MTVTVFYDALFETLLAMCFVRPETVFQVCELVTSILAETGDGGVFQGLIVIICDLVFWLQGEALEAIVWVVAARMTVSGDGLFSPLLEPLSRTFLRNPSRAWVHGIPERGIVRVCSVGRLRDSLRRCPTSAFELRHIKGIAALWWWSWFGSVSLIQLWVRIVILVRATIPVKGKMQITVRRTGMMF